jgi:hypothetical protein
MGRSCSDLCFTMAGCTKGRDKHGCHALCHKCRKYIAGALCAGMRCIDAMQCNATDNVNIAMAVYGGYM